MPESGEWAVINADNSEISQYLRNGQALEAATLVVFLLRNHPVVKISHMKRGIDRVVWLRFQKHIAKLAAQKGRAVVLS